MKIEKFSITIGDDVLADLKDRLNKTRWAEDFANDGWQYGTNGRYLKELVDYWRDNYRLNHARVTDGCSPAEHKIFDTRNSRRPLVGNNGGYHMGFRRWFKRL